MLQRQPLDDMQNYLVGEFVEEYLEGHLSRRDTLRQLTLILGSSAAATSVLAACGAPAAAPTAAPTAVPAKPTTAPAATTAPMATTAPAATAAPAGTPAASPAAAKPTVNPITIPPTDAAISNAGMVEIKTSSGTLFAYHARPAGSTPRPIVIVIHENRGLTDHIQDVVRRAAKAGFVAYGPDLLSRAGGTAKFTDPAQATGAIGQVKAEDVIEDLKSLVGYAQGQGDVKGDSLGMVGFCWGGGQTWRAATALPNLKAAVPFYGPGPQPDQVKNIKAAVLGIYGETDARITGGVPDLEKALKEANVVYQVKIYPGAAHAFHNDTGANFKADAAKDAWEQTVAWFNKYLV